MPSHPVNPPDLRWLKVLAGADASAAWKSFLRQHGGVMLSVIRQYQRDPQCINDVFLFVCEKLIDNQFRRLRRYAPASDACFDSWLRTVVAHLCVDFHRSRSGRLRPTRTVLALSNLHRRVFTCRFGQQLNIAECLATLQPEFPELNELRLAAVIAELNGSLDSAQHWRLKMRQQGFVSLEDSSVEPRAELQSSAVGPEQLAINTEDKARVAAALARLRPQDRLLLRARFEQERPLREVARIAGLSDPYQARYRIERALEQLAGMLAD
jgi:RNA polymerase sigma factor (sigma-70 family)